MSAAAAAGGARAAGVASLMALRGESPGDALGGAQRHQLLGAERIACRHFPRLLHQGDRCTVTRQAIEVGTVAGGEGLEPLERAGRLEGLRVQLDGGVRAEDACAAARPFLGLTRMRRAVGAEKQPRASRRHGTQQRRAVGLRLEHRQAVVVRAQAAGEQRLAVQQQVLRRDGRHDPVPPRKDEVHGGAGGDVLEHNAQLAVALRERREHRIDERGFPVEHIDRGVGDFPVHLQHHAELGHAREHRVDAPHVGDSRLGMRGVAGGIELAAEHAATRLGPLHLVRGGGVGQIQRHQRLELQPARQRRQDAAAVGEGGFRRRERTCQVRHHHGTREARRGERQHGVQGCAIAQVQMPVVRAAHDEGAHARRSSAPSTFCPRMSSSASSASSSPTLRPRALTTAGARALGSSAAPRAPGALALTCFPRRCSPSFLILSRAGTTRARRHPRAEHMTEPPKLEDLDPVETREWLESIDSVLRTHGPERAHFLLERLIDYTRRSGAYLPFRPNTAYVNTIPTGREPEYPGNRALERRIEAYIRWNALAMVLQANRVSSEYGGHLSSYASSATLYEVGFNHVWRAASEQHPGDMVFVQGHSSPGIYARAYLEGRLDEQRLLHFRQEAGGPGVGLSSYPHPWLMPDFWQFPTVSMGLGPMMAIFQARFTRYLEHRGLVKPSDRKVWAFLGDGEMDEPESMGALTMPVREGLDNLIFVINCNLQRLDGPVRGNGKIIQELEAAFLGAGWNVIKVLWGSRWDPLLMRDTQGLLRRVMEECVDGEYQNFKAKGGAYTREHFFGKYPELKAMVANMSDEEIWRLNRGGHDPRKVYAAYAAAASHKGQPTVILAKTVKGFGLGKGGEGQMIAHQQKKLSTEDLRVFRDRFNIPVSDEDLESLPFRKPDEATDEARYLHERRAALGGYLPSRRHSAPELVIPPLEAFASLLA